SQHARDHAWRSRMTLRVLLPIWTIASVAITVASIGSVFSDGPDFLCMGVFICLFSLLVADATLISRGAIKIMKPPKGGIILRSVDLEFVAAIAEDRAR